ncbi:MAG: transglycosylase SLT domain-containing protein [Candidatus Paceibacterota bacterium]
MKKQQSKRQDGLPVEPIYEPKPHCAHCSCNDHAKPTYHWTKMKVTSPRMRKLTLALTLYLVFFSFPSPLWNSAYAVTPEIIKERTSFEKLTEIETLRRDLSYKAVKILNLKKGVPGGKPRYHGLTRKQADSLIVIGEVFGPGLFAHAVKVAWCESRLNPSAVNGSNRNGTTDRGLFQLNDGGTMQRLGINSREAFDASSAAIAAKVLFDDRGWQPWVCAEHLKISHLKNKNYK